MIEVMVLPIEILVKLDEALDITNTAGQRKYMLSEEQLPELQNSKKNHLKAPL